MVTFDIMHIHRNISQSEDGFQRGVLEIHNTMFNTEYKSIGRRRESNPRVRMRQARNELRHACSLVKACLNIGLNYNVDSKLESIEPNIPQVL
jgi:hypothetical protein